MALGAGGPPGGEGSGGRLGPQRGTGAEPRRGSRGRSPRKQNGFEVFALAEIGSPESDANNPEYLFLNWSFLPMDSTNSNVLFSFRCLTPSQTLLFRNKHRWHMQILCYEQNTYFLRNGRSCRTERSVLTSIKTKTVRIKSLFSQVRKLFKSYSSYM